MYIVTKQNLFQVDLRDDDAYMTSGESDPMVNPLLDLEGTMTSPVPASAIDSDHATVTVTVTVTDSDPCNALQPCL